MYEMTKFGFTNEDIIFTINTPRKVSKHVGKKRISHFETELTAI